MKPKAKCSLEYLINYSNICAFDWLDARCRLFDFPRFLQGRHIVNIPTVFFPEEWEQCALPYEPCGVSLNCYQQLLWCWVALWFLLYDFFIFRLWVEKQEAALMKRRERNAPSPALLSATPTPVCFGDASRLCQRVAKSHKDDWCLWIQTVVLSFSNVFFPALLSLPLSPPAFVREAWAHPYCVQDMGLCPSPTPQ